MSADKKELTKISLETEGRDPKILEADGIAFVTIKDTNNGEHEINCGIVGCLNTKELIMLERAIKEELLKSVRENITPKIEATDGLLDLLRDLLGED